jgi:hypothetical protein
MYEGKDIVDLALTKRGQPYVLGAQVHIANPDWSGPWDCAEFVSWACYHAYKSVIAVRPPDVRTGESYSGWWDEDATRLGGRIDAKAAIGTPGAVLIRRPGDFGRKIGHVAISIGDNTTIEAHSCAVGVQRIEAANTRPWTTGFLIPGVRYDGAGTAPRLAVPKSLLQLASPYMRGAKVVEVQEALLAKGIHPGPADGIFGPAVATAVAAFQAREWLVVDGVVGPQTRAALGLS